MKIKHSLHIRKDKLPLLAKQGFKITLTQIGRTIRNPDQIDKESDAPKIIVSRRLDENHILRVVYRIDGDIIKSITVYPAEKGRY